MAGFRRRQMGALGRLGIEAKAEKLSGEVVVGRAGKRRLREHGAALAHHQDVPVADEVGGDEPVDLQGGDVARPAGQIDNGIGPLLRRARRVFRDHEPNCATGRPAAIFRHDEIAAARFSQLLRRPAVSGTAPARNAAPVTERCPPRVPGPARRREGRAGEGVGDRQPRFEPSVQRGDRQDSL